MSALDLESLLAPITPERPCGEDLEYAPAFAQLEVLATGTPERQIGDLIEVAQPPNWRDVKDGALALAANTRDLRVILLLIQAEMHLSGLPGFAAGLALAKASVSLYWDSIFPALDPDDGNDPSQRLNILSALYDHETVLKHMASLPLVNSRMLGAVSLRDFQNAVARAAVEGESASTDVARIQAVMEDVGASTVSVAYETVKECISTLGALEEELVQLVGIGNAISFTPLRDLLSEMQRDLFRYIPAIESDVLPNPEVDDEDQTLIRSVGPNGRGIGAIANRNDVVRTLDMICQYYEQNEPSSPLPLLLKRAKRLVSMSFMDVLKDLAPDGVSQAELIRGPTDGE